MKKLAALWTFGMMLGVGTWSPDPTSLCGSGCSVDARGWTITTAGALGTIQTSNDSGTEDDNVLASLDRFGNFVLEEEGSAPPGRAGAGKLSDESLNVVISADDLVGIDRWRIDTHGGDDVLSIDNSNGLIPGTLTYDGGEGFDSLVLYGSTAANTSYSPGPTVDAGIVLQEGGGTTQRVDFSGLEPIQVLAPMGGNNILNVASAPLGVGFPQALDGPNAISLTVGPNSNEPADPVFAGGSTGFVAVDAFETLEFANFEVLNISAGAGDDVVDLTTPTMPDELNTINVDLMEDDDTLTLVPVNGIALVAEGGDHVNGDRLIVDGQGQPTVNTGAQILVNGFTQISHTGFEDVEIRNAPVDLAVSKLESIDPVQPGSGAGNLSYVISVTNQGPSDATGVELSEVLVLPPGVTIDSITPSAGAFVDPVWSVGSLSVNASETLTVVLTVGPTTQAGTDVISDTATLTALDGTDTNPSNDSATEDTSVIGSLGGCARD